MFSPLQRKLVAHGALILLIAMLAGVGLLASLVGGIELWPGHIVNFGLPGNPSSWARTHVGGILNALLIFVVALLLPGLGVTEKKAGRIGWLIVGTGWANTVFYWAAMWAPNRALTFGDNHFGPASLAGVVGLLPALVFAIVSLVAVGMIAAQAWRKSP
ncbi:MAG: hypothetical protein QM741_14875 [Rudaea sp.]|uniref:styrene-oxide isomerase StyC n=1 Tax=Rudaea sp. TaxID=2136325 RepID=UPI0039E67777